MILGGQLQAIVSFLVALWYHGESRNNI